MKEKFKKLLCNKGFYTLLAFAVILAGTGSYLSRYQEQMKQATAIIQPSPAPSVPTESEIPVVSQVAKKSSVPVTTPVPTPEPQAPPKLILPLQGEMSCGFSGDALVFSKTMQDWRVHSGIDITGDIGTQVKAAADGVVKEIYNDELLGTTVILTHSGGMETAYCSLQEGIVVEKGQKVSAGETVGGIGVSAQNEVSEPPHLHFEVRLDGKDVDPFEYMK